MPRAGDAERLLALGMRESLKRLRCNTEWCTGSLTGSTGSLRVEVPVRVLREEELGMGVKALFKNVDEMLPGAGKVFESQDPTPLVSVVLKLLPLLLLRNEFSVPLISFPTRSEGAPILKLTTSLEALVSGVTESLPDVSLFDTLSAPLWECKEPFTVAEDTDEHSTVNNVPISLG